MVVLWTAGPWELSCTSCELWTPHLTLTLTLTPTPTPTSVYTVCLQCDHVRLCAVTCLSNICLNVCLYVLRLYFISTVCRETHLSMMKAMMMIMKTMTRTCSGRFWQGTTSLIPRTGTTFQTQVNLPVGGRRQINRCAGIKKCSENACVLKMVLELSSVLRMHVF